MNALSNTIRTLSAAAILGAGFASTPVLATDANRAYDRHVAGQHIGQSVPVTTGQAAGDSREMRSESPASNANERLWQLIELHRMSAS
jgi:hypothetical protein